MTDLSRRTTMGLGLAASAATLSPRRVRAQTPAEVKIAMLVPLSGPWARQGILEQMGARLAIDDVNAAGGIKALGGAKLKLVEFDATHKIFTNPTDKRTEDYITGRFG